MRVSRRGSAAVAVGAALALVAAGCSSDGDGTTASTDGEITVTGNQPENPLVPSNTTETQGGKVVDAIFTGLINYNPDDAKAENAAAEKFETTDNQTYTVTLKKGWKFHDGTEVKAKNFVDAWNWSAYSPNGAQNSSFFGSIQGFEDVQSEDPDEDGPKQAPKPKTETRTARRAKREFIESRIHPAWWPAQKVIIVVKDPELSNRTRVDGGSACRFPLPDERGRK